MTTVCLDGTPCSARGDEVVARTCPSGPLLVRGADAVTDAAGVEHPVMRPVVAVCRCGKSGRGPWCDGTHKAIPTEEPW